MNVGELFEILKVKAGEAGARLPDDFAAVALIELTGPGAARWHAVAGGGRLDLAEGDPPGEADLTVTLAGETAVGLYLKTVKPLPAFLTGKIKVRGDAGKIGLIKSLLAGR